MTPRHLVAVALDRIAAELTLSRGKAWDATAVERAMERAGTKA